MSAVLIEKLRDALATRREIRLAILFGSVARGQATPTSDVDLAILAPEADPLGLARDLSLTIGREVQIVDLRQVGYPMLQALVRDGIVVAEGRRGDASTWRTRALLELETDRPWFERMRNAYFAHLAAGRPG